MSLRPIIFALVIFELLSSCQVTSSKESIADPPAQKMKALIIDGENNHGVFPKTTIMMKYYLEETGLFEVDIARTKYVWQGGAYNAIEGVDSAQQLLELYPLEDHPASMSVKSPQADPDFQPSFANYDVVVSNFGWKASDWSAETKKFFEDYMKEGGGFVAVHAANNSWPEWPEYNKMIGLGGWGGRNADSGPFVYYDEEGELQYDKSEGSAGAHGPQAEFLVQTRAAKHPIMKGLPNSWMHTKDELYGRLRGPAENMTVLATALSELADGSDSSNGNTERHEPMLMAIEYGKGRVFHTALGHMDYSVACVGFISTFQRGAEWAASGKVTQEVPSDFPSKDKSSFRLWDK